MLVLHDLNLACRYAHHLVAMKDGAIVAQGPPGRGHHRRRSSRDVFDLRCQVIDDPLTGTPLVLPIPAAHRPPGAPAAVAGPSPASVVASAGTSASSTNGRLSTLVK